MKKKSILFTALLISGAVFSQVGVNTQSPNATLDVVANTISATTSKDGFIPPRVSKATLASKTSGTYTTDQTGAIVYVNDVTSGTGTSAAQVADVTTVGYYYFDGATSKWIKLGSGVQAGDPTPDAFIDDATNAVVKLGATSTGATRATGSEFVIKDTGNVGIGTANPNSNLVVEGSYEGAFKEITANTTLSASDQYINVTGSTAITVTLPDAAVSNLFSGRIYHIKNTSTQDVTIIGYSNTQNLRTVNNTTSNTFILRAGTSAKVVKNQYTNTSNPLWEIFNQSTINIDNNTQTLSYARSITSPINSNTPVNSVVTIGNITIRYNGTSSPTAGVIQYQVTTPNHVTIWYKKAGVGGTGLDKYGQINSSANTWYNIVYSGLDAGNNISPANRDVSETIIVLHNSKEVYRITSNLNGDIAASGTIPAVDSSVTLFIEKLSL